ncbi:MAG: exopolyphosphatase, partial [Gammaproteobacteria bacterium]|nr:exopolyphosphatase [Gammaproteobacteria bacterium]
MSENRRHYTAAVDLGSNSFHMIVAEVRDGQLQIIDRLREMVQLADGLDEKNNLSAEARDRAITCLRQFGQRLQGIPGSRIRAVGTNALRQAKNGVEFQRAAESALGHPIEIISGREEARLVYLGVSHNITDPDSRQLVIDIGGGSTELIIGQHHQPLLTESLLLGCISYTKKYFADGAVTRARVNAARRDAELEFAPIESAYQEMGWQRVIGSSGTVKALAELAHAHGLCTEGLMTRSALETLTEQLITAGRAEPLAQGEVSPRRLSVLPGGLCVLRAAMERLEFETLHVSDQALREGLLYDFLERIQHHDIRNHTVSNMATRYHLDTTHADLVKQSALALFDQLQPESGLNEA